MANKIKIDEEFSKLNPPLTEHQRKSLRASIKEEGLLDPLIVWHDPANPPDEDTLVDGHHRLAICRQLRIEPETKPVELEDRFDALAWIAAHQRARRNMSKVREIVQVLKLKPSFVAEAKERMLRGKADPEMKSPQGRVRRLLAAQAVCSEQTMARVEYILKQTMGGESIISRIEEGESTIAKEYEAIRAAVATRDRTPTPAEQKAADEKKAVRYFTTVRRGLDLIKGSGGEGFLATLGDYHLRQIMDNATAALSALLTEHENRGLADPRLPYLRTIAGRPYEPSVENKAAEADAA